MTDDQLVSARDAARNVDVNKASDLINRPSFDIGITQDFDLGMAGTDNSSAL